MLKYEGNNRLFVIKSVNKVEFYYSSGVDVTFKNLINHRNSLCSFAITTEIIASLEERRYGESVVDIVGDGSRLERK